MDPMDRLAREHAFFERLAGMSDELLAVLTRFDAFHSDWEIEAARRAARRRRPPAVAADEQAARQVSDNLAALMNFSQTGITYAFAYNGGGAVALLGLLSLDALSQGADAQMLGRLTGPMPIFMAGVVLAALAIVAAFFTRLQFYAAAEAKLRREPAESRRRRAGLLNVAAIVLTLCSYVAAGWATYDGYVALQDIAEAGQAAAGSEGNTDSRP